VPLDTANVCRTVPSSPTLDAMTHTPHDALVKRMLQDPKNAVPLLCAALPAAIVARCDWSTLKLADRSFIDERFREVHSDLLYEIQVGRHRALIYVLLEHKSECDPRTVVQMFVYVGRILDRYAEVTEEGRLRVPLVLPLILHHSESGWSATTDLEAAYGEVLKEAPELGEYAAKLTCRLLDVSHMSDQRLMEMALGEAVSLMLWALRDARSPARLLKTFGFWAGLIVPLLQAPDGWRALRVLFKYISEVSEISGQELFEALAEAAPEAKEAIMTLAEQLRREGRQEGHREGRLEGEASVLQRQLERKFGALPEQLKRRLGEATEEQLGCWAERILTADSVEAVFAE
jgi:predicted transposase YdaD